MEGLLREIRACTLCKSQLAFEPRPVLEAHPDAKILVIGQAPGTKVHRSGIPWNDPSGDRLRMWLDVTKEEFYDTTKFAIVPMGFCYPGKGKSGDLPPRPECAPAWHDKVLAQLPNIDLILLIGQYAQKYYLKKRRKKNLTETVRNMENYLPAYFPLPHPSPRNRLWLKKNFWFEEQIVPQLQKKVKALLSTRV